MKPDDILDRSLSPADLPSPKISLGLLARAQEGDHAALQELLIRYQDRLRSIVGMQLGPALRRHCDSMDIVQQTYQAALPGIVSLRPRNAAGLLKWLTMIATNQVRDTLDHWHAAKRDIGREVPLHDDPSSSSLPVQLPPSPGTSPEVRVQLSEIRQLLDAEVARLPEDQRQVVLLHDYYGDDWDSITEALGRETTHATRQLHQRAWIRLRQVLGPKLKGMD